MHTYGDPAASAHPYGSPATTPPAANFSGYVAIITAVIAPPADSPVTYTREGSPETSASCRSTIWAREAASPCPRRMSLLWNQLKHWLRLLPLCCCGSTTEKPQRSASRVQPVPEAYPAAFWVQPCRATTTGRPAGSPSGT